LPQASSTLIESTFHFGCPLNAMGSKPIRLVSQTPSRGILF
jgi:hypothetical protein